MRITTSAWLRLWKNCSADLLIWSRNAPSEIDIFERLSSLLDNFFMTVATKKLLLDVREAGESILQHTAGKNLAEYTAERFFRRAVEREFEIIGEALNRIDRLDPLVAARISELRPVVDFRNRIIHGMTQWTTRWCGASLKGICRS